MTYPVVQFINKKMMYLSIRSLCISFLCVGMPVGLIISNIIQSFANKKYVFNYISAINLKNKVYFLIMGIKFVYILIK